MGQTLTNGIFLPNEGERNCYTGLAGNWRAIDGYIGGYNVHIADAVIHVSQADRDKWDNVDNKADASALTAHTGDTTIHVTAADKEAWNGKANDADVLHKNAADTMPETLTFLKNPTVKNEDVTRGSTTGGGTRYINFTDANNNALGSLAVAKVSNGSTAISLRVDTTDNNDTAINSQFQFFITKTGVKIISSTVDGDISLGRASNKWSDVATYKINNLEPSSLFMPVDRGSRVDIAAYFSNTGSGYTNDYIAPANGYILLNLTNVKAVTCYSLDGSSITNYAQSYQRSDDGQIYAFFPVRKNDKFRSLWYSIGGTVTVAGAFFIPCKGNA